MATKQPARAKHPDTYLGARWTPSGAPMPDPPIPLTERGDDNTLLAPDRSAGLGFSRYV
jgi:hypothetical protein